MRSRLNFFYTLLFFYFILDVYSYFGLRSLFQDRANRLIFTIAYLLISLLIYFSFYRFAIIVSGGGMFKSAQVNVHLGIIFTAIVTKLFFVLFLLPQDLGRLLYALYAVLTGNPIQSVAEGAVSYVPSRRKFLTLSAAGLAGIPFSLMLYGITKGKYAYTVKRVKVAFKDLPKAFDGFRIVQISDIHAGSLDSKRSVEKGIKMINEESPDLILFTGDLVNSSKDEINPYIDIFGQLKATHGKYCTLGNHDYAGVPDGQEEERTYWADFHEKYKAMGFNLMNNENTFIEKEGTRICLMGVENWGKGPWFPKRADIDKALENTTPEEFCILMSHDPSHWDEKIMDHQKHIHLTLSGHTHGFQFGINMPGLKWSPVQYRYPRWHGLYEEKGQYLYVNRGFGFLAFPGRIGMWPEITVIELSSLA